MAVRYGSARRVSSARAWARCGVGGLLEPGGGADGAAADAVPELVERVDVQRRAELGDGAADQRGERVGGRVALASPGRRGRRRGPWRRARAARGTRPRPPGPRPRARPARATRRSSATAASACGRWLTRNAPSATSNASSANGSCSASACTKSSVGWRRRASATMPAARSTPVTSRPARGRRGGERARGRSRRRAPASRARRARRAAARSRTRSRAPSARRTSPRAPSSRRPRRP